MSGFLLPLASFPMIFSILRISQRLPRQIEEQREKLKTEMLGQSLHHTCIFHIIHVSSSPVLSDPTLTLVSFPLSQANSKIWATWFCGLSDSQPTISKWCRIPTRALTALTLCRTVQQPRQRPHSRRRHPPPRNKDFGDLALNTGSKAVVLFSSGH